MVPHMVYCDILITIQRQFINVQYRDTSKRQKYGPYRGIYINIAKTAIASLYFQCYNPISYSGHPRGSKTYRFTKMWGGGGGARGSYLARGLHHVKNKMHYYNTTIVTINEFRSSV